MGLIKYKLRELIDKYDQKCEIANLTVNEISRINREKEFFEPSRQVGKNTSNYKIVSPTYTVFRVINHKIVLNEYLFMYLNSKEKYLCDRLKFKKNMLMYIKHS